MGKKKEKKKKSKKKKVKPIIHPVKLRLGKKTDFLELDKYEGKKKVWKPRFGLPYWMINSKGKIENKPYILDEDTDLKEFSNYLVREQILVPISIFD